MHKILWSKSLLRILSFAVASLAFLHFLVVVTGSEPVEPAMAVREIVLISAVVMLYFVDNGQAESRRSAAQEEI